MTRALQINPICWKFQFMVKVQLQWACNLSGEKKWYYRPFSSGSIMIVRTATISTFQPNFSIADFRALNVTTWNCHFLVMSCDFDFNTHTLMISQTHENQIIISERYKRVLLWIIFHWYRVDLQSFARSVQFTVFLFILSPFVCIAWIRSICL